MPIDPQEIYKKGEEVFYYEGGGIYRVLVLENKCDKEKLEYKLRILNFEQDIFGGNSCFESGLEFVCSKVRAYSNIPLMWTMAAGKNRLIKRLREQGLNI
jgi:hypothetical protein